MCVCACVCVCVCVCMCVCVCVCVYTTIIICVSPENVLKWISVAKIEEHQRVVEYGHQW